MFITINGREVFVYGEHKELALASPMFQDWVERLGPRFEVHEIEFQSVDVVGSEREQRVLFLKFKADVTDDKGNFVPGITFMRGGAVAVLIVLDVEDDEEYTVLTVQPRFPAGVFDLAEIPAGMLDGNGHFGGVAAREIKEEVGFEITEEELLDLTAIYEGKGYPGIYTSPGGSDEFLRILLYRRMVNREELESIEGRMTGIAEEGENIRLSVVPLGDAWKYLADAKSLATIYLYKIQVKLPEFFDSFQGNLS